MDAKQTIKKYISGSKAMNIAAIAFLIGALACLVMAFVSVMGDDASAAEEFDYENAANSYAYVRIVGLSDWVCGYDGGDTYYLGISGDDDLYILRIKDKDLKTLGEYRDYFEGDYPGGGVPYPKTLYGTVKRMNSEVKESFAEYLGVTVSELNKYLGGMYLDTGSTPGQDGMGGWLGGVFFCLLFGLIAFIPGLTKMRTVKKSLAALEASGHLERAAREMEAANNILLGKDQLRLTPNYVFSRNGVALPYSEIVWCFRRVQRVNFVAVNASLVVYTPTMKDLVLLTLPPKDKAELGRQVTEAICRRNPNVMLGFSTENRKAYNQLAKEAKINKNA